MTADHSRWLTDLRARASRPPLQPREPLAIDAAMVGSVEPALARRLVAARLPLRRIATGWRIEGAADAALAAIAAWLHAEGLCSRWRGELLAVVDADGARRAAVERAAVRPLGIATHAVHLVGTGADGGWWVQQRAFDKSTDPGLWDTLMGGLMAAGETTDLTLARETAEEAGLEIGELENVRRVDRLTVRRPVADGYMVEHIEVHEAALPARLVPVNRDGEVARFECLSTEALVERLHADAFTLEAALILAGALVRHGRLGGA